MIQEVDNISDKINLDFINTESRKSKVRYQKPESLKELERIYFEMKKVRHPNNPAVIKTNFRDDTANELTRCIIAWLKINGHFGARVNTMGTYNQKLGKYIRSGSRKGMADITGIISGRHVSIEVKKGRDKMRPEQIKVKAEVEASGGAYIVTTGFDDFLNQINKLK